ncbi:MAG: O-methyltransferase [Natronomonas sp.]
MAVPPEIQTFAATVGVEPDEIQREMQRRGEETEFPTIGPELGGWLYVLARLTNARRVFEFGSGFGYSAYWFCRAVPADGEVVLTEVDAAELEAAREYLDRGGFGDIAAFELGDAIDTIDAYDGPFDVVLIDNEKRRYREAFEAVRPKIAAGGVVIADNAIVGPHDFEAVHDLVVGEASGDERTTASGIAEYVRAVRADPDFESAVLPLGEGAIVSHNSGETT